MPIRTLIFIIFVLLDYCAIYIPAYYRSLGNIVPNWIDDSVPILTFLVFMVGLFSIPYDIRKFIENKSKK
jgi:hypothetical protein